MDRSEKLAIWISGLLLVCFTAAMVYAFFELGIQFPGCITDKEPFTEGKVIERGVGEYEVHYVAKMWAFEPAVLEVPVGSKVDMYLSSIDVNHGFQIKFTNVNIMAVPGTVNYATATFDKPGDYPVVCHEYCGSGHQNMSAVIRVKPRDASLSGAVPESDLKITSVAKAETELAEAEKALLTAKGCLACHSLDGSRMVGPSLKGLYGKEELLADGTKVTVDDAYLKESILEPLAKVVKGYPPVMIKMPVTDEEVATLLAAIKKIQ